MALPPVWSHRAAHVDMGLHRGHARPLGLLRRPGAQRGRAGQPAAGPGLQPGAPAPERLPAPGGGRGPGLRLPGAGPGDGARLPGRRGPGGPRPHLRQLRRHGARGLLGLQRVESHDLGQRRRQRLSAPEPPADAAGCVWAGCKRARRCWCEEGLNKREPGLGSCRIAGEGPTNDLIMETSKARCTEEGCHEEVSIEQMVGKVRGCKSEGTASLYNSAC